MFVVVVLTWPPGGALTINAVLVTGALLIWHHGRPFDLSNALAAQFLTSTFKNFACLTCIYSLCAWVIFFSDWALAPHLQLVMFVVTAWCVRIAPGPFVATVRIK
jgi:hypothetical protein